MSVMRRVRPVWAVVAAACAVVVVASVVGSLLTGIGWWSWGRGQIQSGPQRVDLFVIADGGIRYAQQTQVPVLTGIPIVSNFFRMKAPSAWVPQVSFASGQREVIVPFWTVGAIALIGGVFAWRRSRRPGPGLCAKCRYDLAGLSAGAKCPECGTEVEIAASGGKAAAA